MVAKIMHGNDLWGAVTYNQNKVDERQASVIYSQDILFSTDLTYTIKDTVKSFDLQMIMNNRTKKPVIHISLNPDPKDKIDDETAKLIAQKYLDSLGYGRQPYVLYRHNDIERTHYHIVTVCVDEQGNKINDKFEKRRSMETCRSLEKEFNLTIPTKRQLYEESLVKQVDYHKGDLQSQLKSVTTQLLNTYRVTGLNEYRTLLELHGITLSHIEGRLDDKPIHGIVYSAINENGEKQGKPIKSSTLDNTSGYKDLTAKIRRDKKQITEKNKDFIRKVIMQCMYRCKSRSKEELTELLKKRGIDMVLWTNQEGRTYGVTFVDHHSKIVIKGSGLGKEFAANYLNNFFDNPYFILSEEFANKGIEEFPTKEKRTTGEGMLLGGGSGYDPDEEVWKRKKRKRKNHGNSY